MELIERISIVEKNINAIHSIAHKYNIEWYDHDDLVSYIRLRLLVDLSKYDRNRWGPWSLIFHLSKRYLWDLSDRTNAVKRWGWLSRVDIATIDISNNERSFELDHEETFKKLADKYSKYLVKEHGYCTGFINSKSYVITKRDAFDKEIFQLHLTNIKNWLKAEWLELEDIFKGFNPWISTHNVRPWNE